MIGPDATFPPGQGSGSTATMLDILNRLIIGYLYRRTGHIMQPAMLGDIGALPKAAQERTALYLGSYNSATYLETSEPALV